MDKKKLLVLGGTGEIGRTVIPLMSTQYSITATYRNAERIFDEQHIDWHFYEPDKNEYLAVAKNLRDFDLVINLIGNRREDKLGEETSLNLSIDENIAVILDLANCFDVILKKKGTFINLSSIAALHPSVSEFSYGLSKTMVNHTIRQLQNKYVKQFRIINICAGAIKTDLVADRPDYDNFINVSELVELICFLGSKTKSFTIPEVILYRAD